MSGKSGTRSDGRLGFFEAASIIAGCGIGGGVLALPWLVSLNGILPSLAVLSAAYLLSLLLHLMIAEVSAGEESGKQIVELFRKYLFTGRGGAMLTWSFFGVMGIVFIANLAAYVAGGGEVLASSGVSAPWGSLLFYAAAASVTIFGLKALGSAEKWAVIGMGILFAGLVIVSMISLASAGPATPANPPSPGFSRLLALYGMGMFCFAAYFSVPQAVRGLADRPRLIPTAVATGLGINFAVMLVVTSLSLLLCPEPTAIATIGWSKALGPAAEVAGTLFVILAMLTSYWSLSFAFADIIRERLGISRFASWLIATLPTLAIAFAGAGGFIKFMRTAGGGTAVFVAVLAVPMYKKYRRSREETAILGPFLSSPHWGWIVVIAYLMMAAGSMVSIG
ncbi:MAG: hypothetical protein NTZ12_01150 [Candidatus Aminicenantes bacterium]|nr:hypothetical protein [Candidatus Aminicenantes bacterium]